MPITLLVPLITQVGIPLATQLISLWEKGGNVTAEQFAALIAQTQVSARTVMEQQLAKAGIAIDSPQGVAMLALTS